MTSHLSIKGIDTAIGAAVRRLRVRNGLSTPELAERAQLAPFDLERAESGHLRLTAEEIARLSSALCVQVSALTADDESGRRVVQIARHLSRGVHHQGLDAGKA